MSVSNDYFGTPNQSPNLNQLFESARAGVQQGMGIVNAYNNAASQSRRYGDVPQYNSPEILSQYQYATQPQRAYRAPDFDRYGWGPGKGGTYVGESMSRYPGIWLDSYGSGGGRF